MNTLMIEEKPRAIQVEFDEFSLSVLMADRRKLVIPLDWYPRLLYATLNERMSYEIWDDGGVLAWPLLDEHIGLTALLSGQRSKESLSSLEKWKKELQQRRKAGDTGTWGQRLDLPDWWKQ